ncbi:HigA family addiction module antitoxin [Rhodococcus sp. WAY2]|uniref:HigA family addiction module antitoxin n=1 Tax=Rhodococcus sp. WAY2 TaxID=2663121 RepID=UPI00131FFAB1|nr:HigA family addiction module antitoxin [Rhodococcus sp. WAY2]QHE73619.1 Plasmid maintenance system antidote protein [Rhodococcus sp. WAY2]
MSTELAVAVPVGEILADELNDRGWTQAEFAEILDRPAQFVSEIVSGKKEITRESATQIAAALKTSPEMWLKIQDKYYLWRHAQDERSQGQLNDVRLRARLKDLAPISVLRQRGIIQGETPSEQARELEHLYNLDNIFSDPAILVAARRSKADEHVSGTQLAWIACVRQRAEELEVGTYDRAALEELAANLTRLIKEPADFIRLPGLFAEVGVRLVFVEAFPGSKMDGCAFLLGDGSPVIGISGRGKRFDKVLFTVLHEVAHIILGHLDDEKYIIDDQGESPTLGAEGPANDQAADWVLPAPLPAVPARINQPWLMSVASSLGIHPIVLIGRLQNDGRIPWKSTLVKNAPSVLAELKKW